MFCTVYLGQCINDNILLNSVLLNSILLNNNILLNNGTVLNLYIGDIRTRS